jgi:hypothetical protein
MLISCGDTTYSFNLFLGDGHFQFAHHQNNINILNVLKIQYATTLAASTQVILFSEMLKFLIFLKLKKFVNENIEFQEYSIHQNENFKIIQLIIQQTCVKAANILM